MDIRATESAPPAPPHTHTHTHTRKHAYTYAYVDTTSDAHTQCRPRPPNVVHGTGRSALSRRGWGLLRLIAMRKEGVTFHGSFFF